MNKLNVHVLYRSAEGVCDRAVVDGLFAQAKVGQLHVTYNEGEGIRRGL